MTDDDETLEAERDRLERLVTGWRNRASQAEAEAERLRAELTEQTARAEWAIDKGRNWRERAEAAQQDAARLRDVALGRVRHVYRGSCPDDLEGWEVRDPECPACQVLGSQP